MGKDAKEEEIVLARISKKDQKYFEDQAKKVKPEDEEKVKTKFGGALERLEKRMRKARYIPDFLSNFVANIKFLYEMLCDEGYTIEWKTKAWIISALLYFISPIDVIPDAIPVVGYADDALYVAWVLHIIDDEIQAYKKFLEDAK